MEVSGDGALGNGEAVGELDMGELDMGELDMVKVIARKRDGGELDPGTLEAVVRGFVGATVPDYQMAAFLMAGYLRGFSSAEAVALTQALLNSGDRLDLSSLSGPTVDKHSTGGVADSTTMVVAPLAVELGMQVLKLSGRGLGHTGGTLDKLESIPGMCTSLASNELLDQVGRIGLAIGAQTDDLVPADRAIYALRDATGTVSNVALIASSVMSKKLAGGAGSILLDVKVGSGAFMKDLASAAELAELCVSIGTQASRATMAVLSDMSQPLGDHVGNATEVMEAIEVLRGNKCGRLRDLCVELASQLSLLAGCARSISEARSKAAQALDDGRALERFCQFVQAQHGDPRVVDDPGLLAVAPVLVEMRAKSAGWLAGIDTEAVGSAAGLLGAGRRSKSDSIDPGVGIELLAKIGHRSDPGEVIARVRARSEASARRAEASIAQALRWSNSPVPVPALVHRIISAPTA